MKTSVLLKLLPAGYIILAIVAGCATATPETPATPVLPTRTPAPASCEELEGTCLNLTFDGEGCIYEGPTEVASGPVSLLFHNMSDEFAAVNLLMLLDGKTIEDVIEYSGEEPTTKHHPPWSRELGTYKATAAGRNRHWKGELEPGEYFMVCAGFSSGVWLGTGLTVK